MYRKGYKRKKQVPIWRCPDGIAWRVCQRIVGKQGRILRQNVYRHPYVSTGLGFSLAVYFIYIFYTGGYMSYLTFDTFRYNDLFSSSDYTFDEAHQVNNYRGRMEKSSLMVKKVVASQNRRSLLIHSNKSTQTNTSLHRTKSDVSTARPGYEKLDRKKTQFIIYTEKAMDTEILSQSFNMHKQFKYIHEPLSLTDHPQFSANEKVELIRNILNCNFQGLYNIASNNWNRIYEIKDIDFKRVYNRMYQKVFCFQKHSEPDCPTKVYYLEDLCSLKQYKIIKLTSVKWLKELTALIDEGVQILHVVKDPRTIAASKLQKIADGLNTHLTTDKVLNDIKIYCYQVQRDISYIGDYIRYQENQGKFGYKLIRYEDIQRSPVEEMFKLYEYLGSSSFDNVLSPFDLQENQLTKFSNNSYFAWKSLTVPLLEDIQRYCGKTMQTLGYLNIDTSKYIPGGPINLQSLTKDKFDADFALL